MTDFGDPFTAVLVVVALVSVATSVVSILSQPSLSGLDNQQTASSTNLLSDRRNRLRPNGRIQDTFGRRLIVPDLISVPITTFISNLSLIHI